MSHVTFLVEQARALQAVINSPCVEIRFKQAAAKELDKVLAQIERAAYSGEERAVDFLESIPKELPDVTTDVILIVEPRERYECYHDGKCVAVFSMLENAVERLPLARIEMV